MRVSSMARLLGLRLAVVENVKTGGGHRERQTELHGAGLLCYVPAAFAWV
jgi:hypothetical protein